MKKHDLLTSRLIVSFLYRFCRAYSWTFRLKIENEKEWMDYLNAGGTVLLCTWHQQFFAVIRHFQNYREFNPSIMISRSRDGDIVAGVAVRSGWTPVRGSSSKGGREALQDMIANLNASRLATHIVDGPRGPAGIVKAGVIRLAEATGATIVPFYVTPEKAWYFNSWDRFQLPKPFSKVVLTFDRMIQFEWTDDREDFEDKRTQLETRMLPALKVKRQDRMVYIPVGESTDGAEQYTYPRSDLQ